MPRSCAFLLWILLLCWSAFSQSRGTIQCDPGSTAPVPAWVAPGRPWVIERLACGQMISVIGIEGFFAESQYSSRPVKYAEIQIGKNMGYVDAKYVRLSETQGSLSSIGYKEMPAVEEPLNKEESEEKKWSLISKDKIEVRDAKLSTPIYVNGPRVLSATVHNTSEYPISHLNLQVQLFDCLGPPKSDYSNCEIVGENESTFSTTIPAKQTRQMKVSLEFKDTPRIQGIFSWRYKVLGIRSE